MNYDFDGIVELAVEWLYTPITQETVGLLGIPQHPYFESIYLGDKDGVFNVLEDVDRFYKLLDDREEYIRKCNEINAILMLLRKPYRIYFLDEIYKEGYADAQYCGNALGNVWSLLENNDSTEDDVKQHMLAWLLAADKDKLMDAKDLKYFNELPETITVYRGLQPDESAKGFSWSLSRKTAEWFAKRFNMHGDVYKLQVSKDNVIAYIGNRNEQEVILDYTKIAEPVLA